MLYTGSFRSIRPDDYDQIWLCVRSLKHMPKNPNQNIFHVPILSPSFELFKATLELKQAKKWNKDIFDKWFAPRFAHEMLTPEAQAKLKELAELSKIKNILIVCYCPDENLCHRSVLKFIIDKMHAGYSMIT